MVATNSTMLPLGTSAPDFALRDATTGTTVALSDFADKPVVLVMFISNHCPYVKHVAAELGRLGQRVRGRRAWPSWPSAATTSSTTPMTHP